MLYPVFLLNEQEGYMDITWPKIFLGFSFLALKCPQSSLKLLVILRLLVLFVMTYCPPQSEE